MTKSDLPLLSVLDIEATVLMKTAELICNTKGLHGETGRLGRGLDPPQRLLPRHAQSRLCSILARCSASSRGSPAGVARLERVFARWQPIKKKKSPIKYGVFTQSQHLNLGRTLVFKAWFYDLTKQAILKLSNKMYLNIFGL